MSFHLIMFKFDFKILTALAIWLITAKTLASSNSALAVSQKKTLKIAIVDNLKYEKFATERYPLDYFQGVDAGLELLSRHNIKAEYRQFIFDKRPLAILEAAKEASKWQPDVVIGPRFSDLFLLLKNEFEGTLVLSPLATATSVYEMESRFYSISPPNESYALAMSNFVRKNFKGRAVHPIIEADCKYCTDWLGQFQKIISSNGKEIELRDPNLFLSTEVEKKEIEELLKNAKQDDLFLIPNRSYTSGTLMGRISNFFKAKNTIFLGADGWGDWSAGYTGKYQTSFSYFGYYLNPFPLVKNEPSTKEFWNLYEKRFKKEPSASISLITFKTIEVILDAFLAGQKSLNSSARVLDGFRLKTKPNKNRYRPSTLGVYEIDQNGERFKEMISINSAEEKQIHE